MALFTRNLILLFLIFGCIDTEQASAEKSIDPVRLYRIGFGVGWSTLSYLEVRQNQSALSTGAVTLSGPVVALNGSLWLIREGLDVFVQGEMMGFKAERENLQAGLRLHWFGDGPWHASLGMGAFGILRFLPKSGQGYSNVYGTFIQPSVGYRWNKATIFPAELLFWGRWGRPIYGGLVSIQDSQDLALGVSWRIPVSPGPAFPSVFLNELIFDVRYEISKYQFNAERIVNTESDRYVFSVGYEF